MRYLPRHGLALLLAVQLLVGPLPAQGQSATPAESHAVPPPPPPIKAAPEIILPEGTVLASGHVLGGATLIKPIPGQAIVRFEDGSEEIWDVEVATDIGTTRIYRAGHVLVAQAEYVARERDGHPSCFVYQMHIAPEWIGAPSGSEAPLGRPGIGTADDRVYSFRETPCP